MCELLVHLNLYEWTICYYCKFPSERKFIRHCIKQNQPQNLRLKAEVKSTPLILQTARESCKAKVTLSETDTLLSLKIFGNTNYLTGNKFVVLTVYLSDRLKALL